MQSGTTSTANSVSQSGDPEVAARTSTSADSGARTDSQAPRMQCGILPVTGPEEHRSAPVTLRDPSRYGVSHASA